MFAAVMSTAFVIGTVDFSIVPMTFGTDRSISPVSNPNTAFMVLVSLITIDNQTESVKVYVFVFVL